MLNSLTVVMAKSGSINTLHLIIIIVANVFVLVVFVYPSVWTNHKPDAQAKDYLVCSSQ